MALTAFQRAICRLLADQRIASGESYIGLFHDADEALALSWEADRQLLEKHGYEVRVIRERPSFVEAEVGKDRDRVLIQWLRDSAYRFFPLVRHADFGLALHPLDLATNKVLSLIGRLEVRDWVDLIHAGERVQPLGYLVWAAAGKDPAFTPDGILDQASRSSRYSAPEILSLAFAGEPPDPADLSRRWHSMLATAKRVIEMLPSMEFGCCVLDSAGRLFGGDLDALRAALLGHELVFHPGRIRGALPEIKL